MITLHANPRKDMFGASITDDGAWGGAKLMSGLKRPLAVFRPVLALTIVRATLTGSEILVGIRDPETNRTHQNVVSVPTRRMRDSVAKRLLRPTRTRQEMSRSELEDLRDEIAHTFSLKLGLADAQERGLVDFDVLDFAAFQGLSVIGEHPDGRPITESLTMFNALIEVRRGDDLVPPATASYHTLAWARTEDFVAMTTLRDPGRLHAGLENGFYCAYGLCLQTSVEMLKSRRSPVQAGGT